MKRIYRGQINKLFIILIAISNYVHCQNEHQIQVFSDTGSIVINQFHLFQNIDDPGLIIWAEPPQNTFNITNPVLYLEDIEPDRVQSFFGISKTQFARFVQKKGLYFYEIDEKFMDIKTSPKFIEARSSQKLIDVKQIPNSIFYAYLFLEDSVYMEFERNYKIKIINSQTKQIFTELDLSVFMEEYDGLWISSPSLSQVKITIFNKNPERSNNNNIHSYIFDKNTGAFIDYQNRQLPYIYQKISQVLATAYGDLILKIKNEGSSDIFGVIREQDSTKIEYIVFQQPIDNFDGKFQSFILDKGDDAPEILIFLENSIMIVSFEQNEENQPTSEYFDYNRNETVNSQLRNSNFQQDLDLYEQFQVFEQNKYFEVLRTLDNQRIIVKDDQGKILIIDLRAETPEYSVISEDNQIIGSQNQEFIFMKNLEFLITKQADKYQLRTTQSFLYVQKNLSENETIDIDIFYKSMIRNTTPKILKVKISRVMDKFEGASCTNLQGFDFEVTNLPNRTFVLLNRFKEISMSEPSITTTFQEGINYFEIEPISFENVENELAERLRNSDLFVYKNNLFYQNKAQPGLLNIESGCSLEIENDGKMSQFNCLKKYLKYTIKNSFIKEYIYIDKFIKSKGFMVELSNSDKEIAILYIAQVDVNYYNSDVQISEKVNTTFKFVLNEEFLSDTGFSQFLRSGGHNFYIIGKQERLIFFGASMTSSIESFSFQQIASFSLQDFGEKIKTNKLHGSIDNPQIYFINQLEGQDKQLISIRLAGNKFFRQNIQIPYNMAEFDIFLGKKFLLIAEGTLGDYNNLFISSINQRRSYWDDLNIKGIVQKTSKIVFVQVFKDLIICIERTGNGKNILWVFEVNQSQLNLFDTNNIIRLRSEISKRFQTFDKISDIKLSFQTKQYSTKQVLLISGRDANNLRVINIRKFSADIIFRLKYNPEHLLKQTIYPKIKIDYVADLHPTYSQFVNFNLTYTYFPEGYARIKYGYKKISLAKGEYILQNMVDILKAKQVSVVHQNDQNQEIPLSSTHPILDGKIRYMGDFSPVKFLDRHKNVYMECYGYSDVELLLNIYDSFDKKPIKTSTIARSQLHISLLSDIQNDEFYLGHMGVDSQTGKQIIEVMIFKEGGMSQKITFDSETEMEIYIRTNFWVKFLLMKNGNEFYCFIIGNDVIYVQRLNKESKMTEQYTTQQIKYTIISRDYLRGNGIFMMVLVSDQLENKFVILQFNFQTKQFDETIIDSPHIFRPSEILCREDFIENSGYVGRCLFSRSEGEVYFANIPKNIKNQQVVFKSILFEGNKNSQGNRLVMDFEGNYFVRVRNYKDGGFLNDQYMYNNKDVSQSTGLEFYDLSQQTTLPIQAYTFPKSFMWIILVPNLDRNLKMRIITSSLWQIQESPQFEIDSTYPDRLIVDSIDFDIQRTALKFIYPDGKIQEIKFSDIFSNNFAYYKKLTVILLFIVASLTFYLLI